MPISSAALPTTAKFLIFFESGSACFSFFRSTSDCRTHSRATSRWAAEPTFAVERRIGVGMLENSRGDFHSQNAAHRVIDPLLRNFALGNKLFGEIDEIDVVVFLTRAVGNHNHIEPGVDGHFDIIFIIR